jgi:hypothetical protein
VVSVTKGLVAFAAQVAVGAISDFLSLPLSASNSTLSFGGAKVATHNLTHARASTPTDGETLFN